MTRPTRGGQLLAQKVFPPPPETTRANVAESLGVSDQAVSSWIVGASRPSTDRQAALEKLLGIPMRAWAEDPETPTDDTVPDSPAA